MYIVFFLQDNFLYIKERKGMRTSLSQPLRRKKTQKTEHRKTTQNDKPKTTQNDKPKTRGHKTTKQKPPRKAPTTAKDAQKAKQPQFRQRKTI